MIELLGQPMCRGRFLGRSEIGSVPRRIRRTVAELPQLRSPDEVRGRLGPVGGQCTECAAFQPGGGARCRVQLGQSCQLAERVEHRNTQLCVCARQCRPVVDQHLAQANQSIVNIVHAGRLGLFIAAD